MPLSKAAPLLANIARRLPSTSILVSSLKLFISRVRENDWRHGVEPMRLLRFDHPLPVCALGPAAAWVVACLAWVDVLVVSTLPLFLEAMDVRKNNALGSRFA